MVNNRKPSDIENPPMVESETERRKSHPDTNQIDRKRSHTESVQDRKKSETSQVERKISESIERRESGPEHFENAATKPIIEKDVDSNVSCCSLIWHWIGFLILTIVAAMLSVALTLAVTSCKTESNFNPNRTQSPTMAITTTTTTPVANTTTTTKPSPKKCSKITPDDKEKISKEVEKLDGNSEHSYKSLADNQTLKDFNSHFIKGECKEDSKLKYCKLKDPDPCECATVESIGKEGMYKKDQITLALPSICI